ncbi:MAG: phosphoribosylformylglycinamidine synthase subunit PurL [Acidobacteriota bacterium]
MSSGENTVEGFYEPPIDAELAAEHGLSAEEYENLLAIMGRKPTYTELGVASALWSEHCSYKSSKVYLREFPSSGPRVLEGPGENAGVVDIGHGWAAVFKMESHNHPSYIEPYQGAATGVGGILRDVFTMGARPIANLNMLCFGEPSAPRMSYLVDGVVRGIGGYGNCVGVPTVGGQTFFHPSYNGNILVNAFCLGVARTERIFTARADGPGNPVLYVGSRTGRDGIHGATMASESFDEGSEAKRPTVQVGDPFTEKVLIEACLEAMRTDAIVAIQDMGAAGLTSSAFEMASRGDLGFRLDLEKVPLREKGLSPYEIMLSESQERMLIVAHKGREEALFNIFERWDLEVSTIGELTDTGRAVLCYDGQVAADIAVEPLTDAAPMYRRPVAEPADLAAQQSAPEVPVANDPGQALLDLLATAELGSKEWIWRQYDHTVRANTVQGPGGDAAVLTLKGTPAALAVTGDVHPVYCALDPRRGGAQAVAESVRNLACVGAEPVGLTDCLNFGNPEVPEVSWQLREAVLGIAEACRAFEVPVISGNVSLYNENEGQSIHPTPSVAVVGLIPDARHRTVAHFLSAGQRVLLLGEDQSEFGGSSYLRLLWDIEQGRPPMVDLAREARLAAVLRAAVRQGLVDTAHDISSGGLGVALAEACFGAGLGARLVVPGGGAQLFSETQGRALVATTGERVDAVLALAEAHGVAALEVGEVGGDRLVVDAPEGGFALDVSRLREAWAIGLPRALGL